MRTLFTVVPLLALSLSGPLSLHAREFSPERILTAQENGIAVRVEGEIITFGDIRREMEPRIPHLYRRSANEQEFRAQMARLQREVVQGLIDRVLVVKDFRDRQMQIPKSVIEGEFNSTIQEDFNGDRDRFLAYLRSRDKTVREFRQDLEERIIMQVMIAQNRRNQAEMSPERILQYYRENSEQFFEDTRLRVRQITVSARDGFSAGERVEQVRSALAEGTSFADVARRYSSDAFAPRGGNLGWIREDGLRPELAAIVFELTEGSHSDPIPFQEDYLLFYVEQRQPAGVRPLDEVRPIIEERLVEVLARESQQRWLERLRNRALVKYYL